MPYGVAWSALTVSGATTPAADIDVKLSNIPTALAERLNGTLIVDATADPWVVKPTILGTVTGKILSVPHTLFHERVSVGSPNAEFNDMYWKVYQDSGVLQAAVQLPPGVTVTLIEILVEQVSSTIDWEFYSMQFDVTPSKDVEQSGNSATAGLHIISSGVISETIASDRHYHIAVDSAASGASLAFRLYGARFTYNAPSANETI